MHLASGRFIITPFDPPFLNASAGDTIRFNSKSESFTLYMFDLNNVRNKRIGAGNSVAYKANSTGPVTFGACRQQNCTLGHSVMPTFFLNPLTQNTYGPIMILEWDRPNCTGGYATFSEYPYDYNTTHDPRRSFRISRQLVRGEQLDISTSSGRDKCGDFNRTIFAGSDSLECYNVWNYTCTRIWVNGGLE
jgi:hypothetical protein